MFRLIPREVKYFDLFDEMCRLISQAAALLADMFNNISQFEEYGHKIKDLEHECDEITHSIIKKLNQSFITPIDREDIYALAGALDDVIDLTESVSAHVDMYHIREATEFSKQIASVLLRATQELTKAVAKIRSNSEALPFFIEIHRLENEGDALYRRAVAELFVNGADTLHVIKWKDLYETLERSIDKCEDVANVLEAIMLKHA